MKSFDEFRNNFAMTAQCKEWLALEKAYGEKLTEKQAANLQAELIWSILRAYHEAYVQREVVDQIPQD